MYTRIHTNLLTKVYFLILDNETALWELWGESHNAALLYKDKISGLFILLFSQMLLISLGFGNNYTRQSKQSN